MARTVFQINRVQNGADQILVVPGGIAEPHGIDYDHPALVAYRERAGVDIVHAAGVYLENRLSLLAAIKAEIDRSTGNANRLADHREIIAFDLNSHRADSVPWEAICRGNVFFSLDPNYPAVARIAPVIKGTTSDRDFVWPLRFLIVLAAAGVSALLEWRKLLEAIKSAGFPISVQVLMAEKAVLDEVEAAAKSPPSQVEIQFQTLASKDVLDLALQSRPHLTHFFCHGSATTRELRLATPADWFNPSGQEKIAYSPSQLTQFRDYVNAVWLITLSSCETTLNTDNAQSIARELISQGVPAVLGMQERVTPTLAEAFVGEFYKQVFRIVSQLNSAAPEEVEWPLALRRARESVCQAHAPGNSAAIKQCKEWTIPALYLRAAALFIRAQEKPTPTQPAPGPKAPLTAQEKQALLGKIFAMRGLYDTLSQTPGTPVEVLQGVKTHIDELTNQLIGA